MQRAFVTGASGFIGRHLVAALLDRNVQVKCLVRRTSQTKHLQHPLVERIECPLDGTSELQRALEGVDAVFHLAGLNHARRKADFYRINGASCSALAEACRRTMNSPCLVLLSSLAAAGPAADPSLIRKETELPNPVSHYGKSKRAGEIEIQKRAGDLPCTVVRPGIVYGSHDTMMALMFKSIYRYRLHMVVGFRTPPLSLIYVEDLVRLILEAALHGERLESNGDRAYSSTGYYFACDDAEHPNYSELGKRIAHALNRSVFIWPLWRWGGRCMAAVSQFATYTVGRSTPVNLDKIREAIAPSWACSSEKARQQLGFRPVSDLDSTLKKTADWYVEHGWL